MVQQSWPQARFCCGTILSAPLHPHRFDGCSLAQVNRIPAIEYVRQRWPYFNRTLAKKRPSHILPTHCEDNGITLYDGTFEEVLKTRQAPLRPGEDWLDALPDTLKNTIFLALFGLHLGQSRIQSYALDEHNRTDWCAPSHVFTLRRQRDFGASAWNYLRCFPRSQVWCEMFGDAPIS